MPPFTSPMPAQIPTPTWDFYTPSTPPSTPRPPLSDAYYHSMHTPLALQERARWLPPQTVSKTTSKTNHHAVPLFPTPAESIPLIAAAIAECRAVRPARAHPISTLAGSARVPDEYAACLGVDRLLESLTRVEGVVREEIAGVTRLARGEAVGVDDVLDVLKQVSDVVKEGQSRVVCRRVALMSHEPVDHQQNDSQVAFHGLEDAICARIDAERFPEWKQSFVLHRDYLVEGKRGGDIWYGVESSRPAVVSRQRMGATEAALERRGRRRAISTWRSGGGVARRRTPKPYSPMRRTAAPRASPIVQTNLHRVSDVKIESPLSAHPVEEFLLEAQQNEHESDDDGLRVVREGVEFVQQRVAGGEQIEDRTGGVVSGALLNGRERPTIRQQRYGVDEEGSDERQWETRASGSGRRAAEQSCPIIVELDDDC